MALWLQIVSQGSVSSSEGLALCAGALLLRQTLCAMRAGLCSRIKTPWGVTPPTRALNENAVPRTMQPLVPSAEFTSGAVLQYFYSLLTLPRGWRRILWIKAPLSSSHCCECGPCSSLCTYISSSFIHLLTTILTPPSVWPLLWCPGLQQVV